MNNEVLKKVIYIISEVSEIPEKDININSNLTSDLELESLDIVSIVSEVENIYKIEILDRDIKTLQTVEDIVNYIINHV